MRRAARAADLLNLKRFHQAKIVTPAEALRRLATAS
jgi:hypothetical protein